MKVHAYYSMDLISLEQRFEFYAQQNKKLLHIPNSKLEKAFISYDMASLATALESGLKFPCLFLEIPGIEKEGAPDNVFENIETSIMVMTRLRDGDYANKSTVIQECKNICDQIYNRMLLDAPIFFESAISKTAEGSMSSSDNLWGWRIDFGFTQVYDAEINTNDWEDLI